MYYVILHILLLVGKSHYKNSLIFKKLVVKEYIFYKYLCVLGWNVSRHWACLSNFKSQLQLLLSLYLALIINVNNAQRQMFYKYIIEHNIKSKLLKCVVHCTSSECRGATIFHMDAEYWKQMTSHYGRQTTEAGK